MELWDLYTENRVKTGETHVRGNPLPKEKYHLVVNVWIKNSEGKYLISRRSRKKSRNPLMFETVGGAVLKGEVQKLKNTLLALNQDEMNKVVAMYKNGSVNVGEFKNLNKDIFNLVLVPKTEFVIATENNQTVVLDITIDKELSQEGQFRELVRAAQLLRKEADFKIEQRVKMYLYTEDKELQEVINKYKDRLFQDVLVSEFCDQKSPDIQKEIEVGDGKVLVKLTACK